MINRYALILTGGKSSRMGKDKAALTLDNTTMLERSVAFWRSSGTVSKILAAAGPKDRKMALPADVQVIYDRQEGLGPMMGILSAFLETDADALYVSAVDMPFLKKEFIPDIPAQKDCVVYRIDGRPEPLFGVYKRSCIEEMQRLLAEGNGKMGALLQAVDTEYYDLGSRAKTMFRNVNTMRDLQRARAGEPPMIGFAGFSGSGKTTFLEKLVKELIARGLRVGVIKHDGHGFQMDHEGKDTHRYRIAGANCVGISSANGWAILGQKEVTPDAMRQAMLAGCKDDGRLDLILVEGYKHASFPKIEVHRQEAGHPLVVLDDTLLAYVTDEKIDSDALQLPLQDSVLCADFLTDYFLKS